MRIVAGSLGGRRLVSPHGDAVRPTPDRVREALFSILGDLEGARVLDLFSGTGAIGFEAISRGAVAATLVDHDTRTIEKNLQRLPIADRVQVLRVDVRRAIPRLSRYDFVFADPPFAEADKMHAFILENASKILAPEGRLVLEHPTRLAPPVAAHDMEKTRSSSYGEATLSFYVEKGTPT